MIILLLINIKMGDFVRIFHLLMINFRRRDSIMEPLNWHTVCSQQYPRWWSIWSFGSSVQSWKISIKSMCRCYKANNFANAIFEAYPKDQRSTLDYQKDRVIGILIRLPHDTPTQQKRRSVNIKNCGRDSGQRELREVNLREAFLRNHKK